MRSRIAVPRHVLSYVVGRAGAGKQEIEATSGASLQVDASHDETTGPSQCEIEAVGDKEQVAKAEEMIRAKMEVDFVEVPASVIPRIIGRGGNSIRALQASTGAILHIPDKHDAMCRIEVFGSVEARAAACARIESAAEPQQRQTLPLVPNAGPPLVPELHREDVRFEMRGNILHLRLHHHRLYLRLWKQHAIGRACYRTYRFLISYLWKAMHLCHGLGKCQLPWTVLLSHPPAIHPQSRHLCHPRQLRLGILILFAVLPSSVLPLTAKAAQLRALLY
jgi:rRNA processing protein Krr1/Pno1